MEPIQSGRESQRYGYIVLVTLANATQQKLNGCFNQVMVVSVAVLSEVGDIFQM